MFAVTMKNDVVSEGEASYRLTCHEQKYIGISGNTSLRAETSACAQSMMKQLGLQSGFTNNALSFTAFKNLPMWAADSDC